MNFGWIGAVTDGGFTAAVEVTGPVDIRLAVSTSSDMSSPIFSSTISDADGWHKLVITGLSADTVYFWSIAEGASVGAAEGSIRTFPPEGEAASFTIAAASCCSNNSNPNTFTRILDRAPTFFMHMGDLHYANITTNSTSAYESAIEGAISQSNQEALHRNIPTFYMWDDHDFGPNNSDGSAVGRPAALATYRKLVPHPPIPFSGPDNDTPVSNTFVCGRVRFVQLDMRSEAVLTSTPETDVMLGTTQLNWLLDLIETFTEAVLVIDVSVPWISDDSRTDAWGNVPNERTAISDAIQEHAQGKVIIIHGDAHMVAMDNGSNSNYATNPSGPGPRVLCYAPLNNTNSIKGGPYSQGTFSSNTRQYGTIAFQDSGSTVTVTATGYRESDDAELVSMEWEIGGTIVSDQVIYWAEDATEADAFPADTACYVLTDGPNPTRVRINSEWFDINTYLKDGAHYSLTEIVHIAELNFITARAVSSGVLDVNGKIFVSASATGAASSSGDATLKIIPVSAQILYWAEDVFVADAFPADTACYVLTDGPNPTRVRMNEEWLDITSFRRDGAYYTLLSIQVGIAEVVSTITARAVSDSNGHAVAKPTSEISAVAASSGDNTRYSFASASVQVEAISSGNFVRVPSVSLSVTGVAQAQAVLEVHTAVTSTVTAVANSEGEQNTIVEFTSSVTASADADASQGVIAFFGSEVQRRAVTASGFLTVILVQGSTVAVSSTAADSSLLKITRRPSSTVTARAVTTGSLGASAEVVARASTQAAAFVTHNSMSAGATALASVEAFADIHVPVSSTVIAVSNTETDAHRLYRVSSFVAGVAFSSGTIFKKAGPFSSVTAKANVFGKWLRKRPFASSVMSLSTASGSLFTTAQFVASLVATASASLVSEATKFATSTVTARAFTDISVTVTPTIFFTSQVTATASISATEGLYIILDPLDITAIARVTGRIRGVLSGDATIPRTASVAFENRRMVVLYSHREVRVTNKKVTVGG